MQRTQAIEEIFKGIDKCKFYEGLAEALRVFVEENSGHQEVLVANLKFLINQTDQDKEIAAHDEKLQEYILQDVDFRKNAIDCSVKPIFFILYGDGAGLNRNVVKDMNQMFQIGLQMLEKPMKSSKATESILQEYLDLCGTFFENILNENKEFAKNYDNFCQINRSEFNKMRDYEELKNSLISIPTKIEEVERQESQLEAQGLRASGFSQLGKSKATDYLELY